MATVAKTITPSVCTTLPVDSDRFQPLPVGEDIAAGDACYIKSDGKIWRSIATAANAAADVIGFASISAKASQRQTLSLYVGLNFSYGPNTLTPGSKLYLSATVAGALDTATSTYAPKAAAVVVENRTASSIVRVNSVLN